MIRALALALLPLAARAAPVPYPPSTCAALWEGLADRFGDEGEPALALRFRAWSESLIGEAETRAPIAERRPWMRDLLAAHALAQDDQSRELFERMAEGCAAMEAGLP